MRLMIPSCFIGANTCFVRYFIADVHLFLTLSHNTDYSPIMFRVSFYSRSSLRSQRFGASQQLFHIRELRHHGHSNRRWFISR